MGKSTLGDLFKFNFLNNAVSFSVLDILVALISALALGLFIFFIYKITFSGVMYSSSFSISLIAMTMITCLIVAAVSTNLITALGMIGALSIIRFRTVIKEPLDLVYVFWSIAAGIIVGVGLIPLAVIGSLAIGGVLYLFVNRKSSSVPYIVVLNCDTDDAENESMQLIKTKTKKHMVKSKSVSKNGIELTVEVRLDNASTEFINEFLKISGVSNAVLVSYNGDYYM